MSAKTINPYTEEQLFEVDYISLEEVNKKINTAHSAYNSWKNKTFEERWELLKNLVKIMWEKKEELAKLNVIEMWMLYNDALWDVSKSMSNIMYFVENTKKLLQEKTFEEWWIKWKVTYSPTWVLYSVAPWNYPFNQVFRSTIPQIIAWNTVVVKHASNLPQVSMMIEKLFLEAWFPQGIYTNLLIPWSYSKDIIENKHVVWTMITWWDKAWRVIWELAWKNLKPSVLELGWNDAFIVSKTNDLDSIVSNAISARLSNCWQKCNSSKRFIVLEEIYDEFVEKFAQKMEDLIIWDPMDSKTKIWPLAKKEAVEEIDIMVKNSIKAGAKIKTWWEKINIKWYFYKPTVIYDVKPWMDVFDKEIFGPVWAIIKAKDIDEAINLANNSVFGLWCSIFWDNKKDLEYIASKVEVSNVWINKIVTSYPFLPYWWIKNTWYGKELWERWIKTFCNEKVVVIG